MKLVIAIVVVSLYALNVWLLWRLQKKTRIVNLDAEIIDKLSGELDAAHAIMSLQSQAIYAQAVQLHGRAAADRAIQEAAKRGTN